MESSLIRAGMLQASNQLCFKRAIVDTKSTAELTVIEGVQYTLNCAREVNSTVCNDHTLHERRRNQ